MSNILNLPDPEFEHRFSNCQIDPAQFNHEAHLKLAWIHIDRYGVEQAEINIQRQLQDFVAYAGAQDKYNKTLTLAAIKAVYHFMLKSSSNNFRDFITEFPRLKYNFKDLMAAHYSQDIFNSERAKKEFLEPDLVPFD